MKKLLFLFPLSLIGTSPKPDTPFNSPKTPLMQKRISKAAEEYQKERIKVIPKLVLPHSALENTKQTSPKHKRTTADK